MRMVDDGHVYDLEQLGTEDKHRLTFIKRSGGAVSYDQEWPGLQTQEVLRALIDRTLYLHDILPCAETLDAVYHMRMALYNYELRAWRRKTVDVNRKDGEHDDEPNLNAHRTMDQDCPFPVEHIETFPIGADGHIMFCMGCNNIIDDQWCWCGDSIVHGPMELGHTPVPIGCTCGYANNDVGDGYE